MDEHLTYDFNVLTEWKAPWRCLEKPENLNAYIYIHAVLVKLLMFQTLGVLTEVKPRLSKASSSSIASQTN